MEKQTGFFASMAIELYGCQLGSTSFALQFPRWKRGRLQGKGRRRIYAGQERRSMLTNPERRTPKVEVGTITGSAKN